MILAEEITAHTISYTNCLGLNLRVPGIIVGLLTLEYEIDILFRNVGKNLPIYAASNPIRAQISFTPRCRSLTLRKASLTQSASVSGPQSAIDRPLVLTRCIHFVG